VLAALDMVVPIALGGDTLTAFEALARASPSSRRNADGLKDILTTGGTP